MLIIFTSILASLIFPLLSSKPAADQSLMITRGEGQDLSFVVKAKAAHASGCNIDSFRGLASRIIEGSVVDRDADVYYFLHGFDVSGQEPLIQIIIISSTPNLVCRMYLRRIRVLTMHLTSSMSTSIQHSVGGRLPQDQEALEASFATRIALVKRRERTDKEYHLVIREFQDVIEQDAAIYIGFNKMFETRRITTIRQVNYKYVSIIIS
jgi:hypothetical protein